MMVKTIDQAVMMHAVNDPDKPAVITGKSIITYRELYGKVLATAQYLQALGVGNNDKVMLSASSSEQFIFAYIATHLVNAIAVPVDPLSAIGRLSYVAKQVEPKIVLSGKSISLGIAPVRSFSEIAELNPVDNCSTLSFPDEKQDADILFTTGTTGEPKGVVLTHFNLVQTAKNINGFIGNTIGDREIAPLPLSHSFGLGRLRCNLLSGGTLIIVGGFSLPGLIFRLMEKNNATGFAAVPAGIALLLRSSGDRLGDYADQLKYIEIGSAPMPLEQKYKLMQLLPKTRICMHYGLTEASRSTFIEFHSAGDKLPDSIGKPAPNVQLNIVDNQYHEVPPHKIGRIMVRGNNVMKQYYKNKEMTKEIFKAGWLYTGDLGYKDENNYFYLKAREKEMINVGGLKVAPAEIEKALLMHGDIMDCACVGMPDPKGITGEVVKAYLVKKNGNSTKPSFDDLFDFLKNSIETYKIPVQIEWVDAIPKTSSGKIQRMKLK
jgi:long-chain acyl-CoA synthetase